MSEVPFHRTQMGHRFFEGTLPSLVRELTKLNANLEQLVAKLDTARISADGAEPTAVVPTEPPPSAAAKPSPTESPR